ncbi:O-antigen ligase [Lewinella sp. JB7]|uniref:O-antigen ligase family protein n=1 Tax=Lewinella sp. JB7 TaxID=2962887 RepID=UPI0020CA0399|nr:O-antigen ligase family protein [Lewinella sp. JB7]MCP9236774.1 O-antigen ligase family protein [Lewinella sp. JB7]
MSKAIERQLVGLFYGVAVIYTIVNLGGTFIGIPGVVFLAIFGVTVVYLYWQTFARTLSKNIASLLTFSIPLFVLNVSFSIEPINTGVYWVLWLMFLIALIKIIQRLNQADLNRILRHVPYMLLVASVVLYIVLFPYLTYSLPTKNSLGLFAGATLISAMSIQSLARKGLVGSVALFILIASDSRSSLVFAIGIVVIYLVSIARMKYGLVYMLAIVLLLIFEQPLYTFFEDKMLKKELYATNLDQAIESAQKERTDLLIAGWELFKERPIEGFGLKTKYYEGRLALTPGAYVHVHNGYLGTLIETGLLISFLVVLFIIKILLKTVRLIVVAPKRYDKIWLFFILFGFIRAYGENYLFFNIGNIFSIVFVFFCLVLLLGGSRLSLLPLRK